LRVVIAFVPFSGENYSMPAIRKSSSDCPCFRISATDTNYFVLLADKVADNVDFVTVVEIFEPGGATPPNAHVAAWEQFVVLSGEGRATCDGRVEPLATGDILIVPPGSEHVIENTGPEKLYCLTTMVPDDGFSELIRSGIPVALTDGDRRVLHERLAASA
jgi:mannose-6-phosphate isomerase-like protein (cupin superfamily)